MAPESERTANDLAGLMRSYNALAAKVAKLQRTAEALEEQIRAREAELQAPRSAPPPPLELPLNEMQERASHLEGELQRSWRQLDQARASAAEWERKAKVLGAQLADRERELAELRHRLAGRNHG